MKRLFITLTFIALSIANATAQTFDSGDFTYCKLYGTYNEVSIKGSTDKTSLTIPSTVDYEGVTYSITGIEYDAFLSHNNLQTISIPNSVQCIWGTPFNGCENLQYIEYDNALYLGNDENKYLWLIKAKSKGITSCGINNNCKHIAENAFDGCDKLTAIVIPNSIADIGHYAFNNCSGLSSVTIPISVITIGTQAFNCDNTIFVCEAQSKPQGWGDYASYYCSGTWNNCQGTTYWGLSFIVGDFAYSIIGDNTVSVRKYLGDGLDVSIPSVVTFNGNEYKVTDIGEAVFKNKDLTEITIPETVKNIGKEAFYGCSGLTEVILPDSLITIGNNAFDGCSCLRIINIPNSVQTINQSVFSNCENLQYNRYDNAFYLGDEENPYLCLVKARNATITSCEINEGCRFIFGYAFSSCSNLTSIEIPDKVLDIGRVAFYHCSSLESVIFGKSVKYIEDDAFCFCSSLQMAIFPNSLKSIRGGFGDCSSLKTIYIPNSVTFISGSPFTGSDAIIYIQDTIYNKWGNDWYLKQLQGVTSPRHKVIKNCFLKDSLIYQITSSVEPYTVKVCKYIGNSSSVIIPETVVSEEMEYEVTDIAENIFSDCASSITLTMESETAPNLSNTNALQSVASIHIPCGSLNNYKSAAYWSSFSNYIEDFSYAFSVQSDDEAKGTIEITKEPTCNENAIIQATAETGYVFEKWSDGNKSNPRHLTVTQDTALVAYFVVDEVEAEIASANTAQGSVSNSTGTYHYNDEIEISATANYGYTFAKWSDGVTTNPRTVVLRKDTVIRAEFAVNQYTITLKTNIAERGSVSGGGAFNYLSNNKISATANTGYVFANWSDGNTANPRTVALTQDTAFTAVFVPAECALQVSSANDAMGAVSNSSGTYYYNDEVEISATANYGYHFTCWNDNVTANPRTVTIKKDTAFTANFTENQYTITVKENIAERGSVSGGGSFNYLTNNKITATPNYGYVFEKWSDGNTDNPRTVALTKDTAFTAVFVQKDFTLSATSANTALGSVTGSGTIKYRETAEITATATAAHHHFVAWSDGTRQNPRTVQVVSDTQFVATFAIDSFTVAATSRTEEFGAVSGSGLYAYGTAVEVKAQPQPHCHFVEWSNGASGLVQQFDVEKDTAFNAAFAIDTHSLQATVADSTMGVATGTGTYDYATAVTLTATAAAGCYFTGWSDGVTANPRILTIGGDTVVVAQFGRLQEFGITVVPSDEARGTVEGTGRYQSGTEATLSATANEHYYFSQWSDGRTDNPRRVRVIADATYTAVFEPEQYSVTLSQNNADMGMVSGSGQYRYGDMVSCLAKPYQNYHFVQWSNGSTANPYEFVIESNQLLTAYFAAGAVTGIEDDAVTEPIIYAVGKTIIIENATGEILVYDAMGRLIGRDVARNVCTISINNSGVYVVKVGNTAKRVAVE